MNKYHNKKTVVNGIVFDSGREAKRYRELKLLEKCGVISDLKLQEPFEIVPKCGKNRSVKYKADFVYKQNGQLIVEDVKGVRTDVYKIKKKLMLWRYGIEIKEI